MGPRHFGNHVTGDFGGFSGDGAGLAAGGGVAAVVGVAAGGDEEGEVEESGFVISGFDGGKRKGEMICMKA